MKGSEELLVLLEAGHPNIEEMYVNNRLIFMKVVHCSSNMYFLYWFLPKAMRDIPEVGLEFLRMESVDEETACYIVRNFPTLLSNSEAIGWFLSRTTTICLDVKNI